MIDSRIFAMLDFGVFAVAAIGFAVWQLYSLNKLKRSRSDNSASD